MRLGLTVGVALGRGVDVGTACVAVASGDGEPSVEGEPVSAPDVGEGVCSVSGVSVGAGAIVGLSVTAPGAEDNNPYR